MDKESNSILTLLGDDLLAAILDTPLDALLYSSLNQAITESNYSLFKTEFLKLPFQSLNTTIEVINHVINQKPYAIEHGIIGWLILAVISYFNNQDNPAQLFERYNEQILKCPKIAESFRLTQYDKFIIVKIDGSTNIDTFRRVILTKLLTLFRQNAPATAYHFFYQLYNDNNTLNEHEKEGVLGLYLEALSSQKDVYENISGLIKANKHPTEVAFKLRDLNCLKQYYNHRQYYDWLLVIKKISPKEFHVNCSFDAFFVSVNILSASERKTETYYQQREKMHGVDGWKNYHKLMEEAAKRPNHDAITMGIKKLAAFHHVTTSSAKGAIILGGLKPSQVVQEQQSDARITTPKTSITSTVFGSALPGDTVIHRSDLSTLIKIPIEERERLDPKLSWTTPHEAGFALSREKINSIVFSGRNGNHTTMNIMFLYNNNEREIHYHFYYRFRDPMTHELTSRTKRIIEAFNDCVYRGNLHDIITARFYIMLERLKHEDDQSDDSPYSCAFKNPDFALQIAAHLVSRRTHELRYDATISVDAMHISVNTQYHLENWRKLCRVSIANHDINAFDNLRTNTPKPFLHANYPHHRDPFVTCFNTTVVELYKLVLLSSSEEDKNTLTTIIEKIVTEGFSSDGPENAIVGTVPLLLRENISYTPFLGSSLYMIIDILALPIFSERLKALIIGYLERNTFNPLLIDYLTLCCNQTSLAILKNGNYPCIKETLPHSVDAPKDLRISNIIAKPFNDPVIDINCYVVLNVFNLINNLEDSSTSDFSNVTHIRSLCHLLMAASESALMQRVNAYRANIQTPTLDDALIIILATLLRFNHHLDSLDAIFKMTVMNNTIDAKSQDQIHSIRLDKKLDLFHVFGAKKIMKENPAALKNINNYLLSEFKRVNKNNTHFNALDKLLFWFIDSRNLDGVEQLITDIKLFSSDSRYRAAIGGTFDRFTYLQYSNFNCANQVVSHYANNESIVEDAKAFKNIIEKTLHTHGEIYNTPDQELSKIIIKAINLKQPEQSYATITLSCIVAFEARKKTNTCSLVFSHFNRKANDEGPQVLSEVYESVIYRQLISSCHTGFDNLIISIINSQVAFTLKNINLCFSHLMHIQEKMQIPIKEQDILATLIHHMKTPGLLLDATVPVLNAPTMLPNYLKLLFHIVKSILLFPKAMANPEHFSLVPPDLGAHYEIIKFMTDPTLFTKLFLIAMPITREHDNSITDNLIFAYLNQLPLHLSISYDNNSIVRVLGSILLDPINSLSATKADEFKLIKEKLLPELSDDEKRIAHETAMIINYLESNRRIDIVFMLLEHYDVFFTIALKQKITLFSALLCRAFRDCRKDETTRWQLGDTAKDIHAFFSTEKISILLRTTLATHQSCSAELSQFLDNVYTHHKHAGELLRVFLDIFVQPFYPQQKLPNHFIFRNYMLEENAQALSEKAIAQGLLVYVFDGSHTTIRRFMINDKLSLLFTTNDVTDFEANLKSSKKNRDRTYETLQFIIKDLVAYPISNAQESMLKSIPVVFRKNILFTRNRHPLLSAIKEASEEVQEKLFAWFYEFLPSSSGFSEAQKTTYEPWYTKQLEKVPDSIKQQSTKKRTSKNGGSSSKKRRASSAASSAQPNGLFSSASSGAAASAASSAQPNGLFNLASSGAGAASHAYAARLTASSTSPMKTGK